MAGEYRAFLRDTKFSDVRIALTNQPIIGMHVRHDLVQPITAVLRGKNDPVATRYVNGLEAGTMVPVTYAESTKVWKPGELFLAS